MLGHQPGRRGRPDHHGTAGGLAAEVAAGKPRLLLIDMTALTFIDSAAIQMIIAACQVFRHDGGTLALIHPTSAAARTLELTGVSRLISIYDNLDEAITAVG